VSTPIDRYLVDATNLELTMLHPPRFSHEGPAPSDHELVTAVRRGDEAAFDELFARYRSGIALYLVGMLRDHARAEDLAQEVFIVALRQLRRDSRPLQFRPWLFEIAKNAGIDELRRRRRRQEIPLDAQAPDPQLEQQLLEAAPETAVENKQRIAQLKHAFDGLSEQHHRVLVMRELAGLSYGEIARRTGMPRSVVDSTLFRARRRLGQEFDAIGSGKRCRSVREAIDSVQDRPVASVGVRQRRLINRHISNCDPCRRYAWLAGLDPAYFEAPSRIGKIAGLLPLPWLRRRSSSSNSTGASSAVHLSPLSRPGSPSGLIRRIV
jgi:RNA polymerase sigma factor (sigma-70 family)